MTGRGPIDIGGVKIWKAALDRATQERLMECVERIAEVAPFFHPETRGGRKMSVRMTSAGICGWVSDRRGYRYERRHPAGMPWPAMPTPFLDLWDRFAACDRAPESCLVNHYVAGVRMGLHQDRDEADLTAPVLSISLGDDALFRIGTLRRGGPTRSLWLSSGDVVLLAGEGRLVHHGIDRIRPGTSRIVPWGGRINLTMRVVTGGDASRSEAEAQD